VATFQLFDVIPNAQTLANMRGSEPRSGLGLVPLWMGGRWKSPALCSYSEAGFLIVVRPCGTRRIGITVFLFLFAALLSPGRSVV